MEMKKHEAFKLMKEANAKQPLVRGSVHFVACSEMCMGAPVGWSVQAIAKQGDRNTAPRAEINNMAEADAFVAAVEAGTAPAHVPNPPRLPFAEVVANFKIVAKELGITIDKREGWRARNGM